MSRALARAAAAGGRADHTVHRSLRRMRGDAAGTRAGRRGMVMGDDVVDVAQPPAGGCERHREASLLAADAVAGVEAAGGEERAAADDRRAGDEAEHLVAQRAAAIVTQAGSSRSSSPTRIRAATAASCGCASRADAARASAPGTHQESSSRNAT